MFASQTNERVAWADIDKKYIHRFGVEKRVKRAVIKKSFCNYVGISFTKSFSFLSRAFENGFWWVNWKLLSAKAKEKKSWQRGIDSSTCHKHTLSTCGEFYFTFFFFTQKLLTNSFHVWSFVTYPASVVLRWCLLFPTKPVAALMYVCVLWSIARWGGCLSRARPPHTICCFFRRSTRHVSHSLYDKVDDAKKPTTTTKMKIFVLLIKPRCCHYLFLGVVALKILLKASEAAVARLSRLSMRTLFHEN